MSENPEPAATRPPDEPYRRERRFARRCALQFLYQADQQDDWGNVERNLNRLKRQVRDAEGCLEGHAFRRSWQFVRRLTEGVCERRVELDALIGRCATNWTVPRMSVVDRNILRLTALQLAFCDDIPALAAVDEAIELAKAFGHRDSARFVNGVLDRLLQETQVRSQDEESPTP
jgi:N utilization substance protein B